MAPRKTTKPPTEAVPESVTPVAKAPARPRAKKALPESVPTPVATPEIEAPAPAVAAVAAAPEVQPKPARRGRPAKAATPEVAPETPAEVPAAVAQPSRIDVGSLITDQARAILGAIQDGRAVELIFADPDQYPPRTFEPRQVIFDTFAQGWYVWGWDRRYNAERHHLLSLVAQVNQVEGLGRAAQGPYKEGTPANLIGGWLGGEAIKVKALLLKQWIFAVRQAPAPFPDFKMEDVEEGKAQITFTATDLRAISRWAMQFGDGIQILEPQRLVDRIKQVGVAWGGKPAAAPAPAPAPAPAAKPRSEHREHRGEHRQEHRSEARESREPREARESREPAERSERKRPEPQRHRESQDSPKPAKPGKIEIRFDRL
jgi:predicted DNA-binding transcriptional regulator YafY